MSRSQLHIRHWALALLLLNLSIFITALIAQKNGYTHPSIHFVKAFAEAACIGALADWFAVVALFRHPLGIPLPHTAVLPAKQAQLAQGVAKFIGTHFLEPRIIADQLTHLQIGERFHRYAQQNLTNTIIGKYLPRVLQMFTRKLPTETPPSLLVWSRSAATTCLSGDRLGRSIAQLLKVAQEQSLDKKLVNMLATSIHTFATAEDAKERVRPWLNELTTAAQQIDASWWEKIKTQFTGQAIEWMDDWIIDKVLTWLADFTHKIQQNDEHPIHAWLKQHIDDWCNKLSNDEHWHTWLAEHTHQWLHTPTAEELVKTIWNKSHSWLNAAAQANSPYIEPLSNKIREIILNYTEDTKQQAKFTAKVAQISSSLLTEHQTNIRDWLTAQMNAWSKERLNNALENAIGNDLQYIRINGTVIGGLMGLVLYGISQIL